EVRRARNRRAEPGEGVDGEQCRHRRGILPRAEAAIVPTPPAECKTSFDPTMDVLGGVFARDLDFRPGRSVAMTRFILTPVVAIAALLALVPIAVSEERKDVLDTANEGGQFKTLVTAFKEAGMAETLKGKGPFTIFAPTDEAFQKVPEDKLKALLADREK